MIDYIVYIDTDSVYIRIGDFIKSYVNEDKWNDLSEDEKIEYIEKASNVIEKYVNKKVFENTQLVDYNSNIVNFKAVFKQETIASSALFVKKKKYAYLCKRDEGIKKDKVKVTGLEIVRSDTPEVARPKIKNILEMILRGKTDNDLEEKINKYKEELKKCLPEEISANIGVNGLNKYIQDKKCVKGTPWHVRGVANYRLLIDKLKLKGLEDIHEGTKVKVVYLKPNRFGIEMVSFYKWYNEFNNIVEVDREKMIYKFFLKKIGMLLEPMKKEYLIENKSKTLSLFF